MRTFIANQNSLTKTLAIALAALGMASSAAATAAADDTRPSTPTESSTQLADAPREPVRSCYDYAAKIYDTWGWYHAAGAYIDCATNPNHPDHADDAPSTRPGGPTELATASREPSRSCYDFAYEVYLTYGWWEAAGAYLNCDGNPNHPENDDKP